jgi:PhzF family phenazine biosynthesis protein
MHITLYQVDAFTKDLFGGNPAAVCPLEHWIPDATMQAIAAENNLSETAFFVPKVDDFEICWFTPVAEVDLAGHPTLATAYVILEILEPKRRDAYGHTLGRQAQNGFSVAPTRVQARVGRCSSCAPRHTD